MLDVSARRESVTIVTVFNDLEMRRSCLDRSIEAHRAEARNLEYLPIDNVGGSFSSAGAALNHGAARATRDYVVFVHQDVYLHSLTALEEAAGILAADESIGMLGAVGPTAEGRFVGRMRDRVILLGEPATEATSVDCLDEVLFVIPRRMFEREPLVEAPELAWHAYALDYGLRVRSHGMRVCAIDMPLTHNSLTINLERLEVAYRAIAARHPQAMPVMTPQGGVGGPTRIRDRTTVLAKYRWRYTWLRESPHARAGSKAAGGCPCVLADIRLDVDELLASLSDRQPLLVVNVDKYRSFPDEHPGRLELTRNGRPILVTSTPLDDAPGAIAAAGNSGPTLVTNLSLEDLRWLGPRVPAEHRILGFRRSLGYWMLLGVDAASVPAAWRAREATPLGMRALPG